MRRDRGRAALAAGFRDAYLADDAVLLARLLGSGVCVVVDSGEAECGPAASGGGIAAALTLLRRALGDPSSLRFEVRSVNGGPGLVASRSRVTVAVIVLAGRPGAVDQLWVVSNPDKLDGWS
ncbi:hypothetical protein AB4Z18_00365 [Leifsonia sp. 2TAF2]|uniref:hypothetical protein n=1 Tax=Leifsonia sp. 2TAF2 TaxID=3233009 RepID=UPI003F9B07FB